MTMKTPEMQRLAQRIHDRCVRSCSWDGNGDRRARVAIEELVAAFGDYLKDTDPEFDRRKFHDAVFPWRKCSVCGR